MESKHNQNESQGVKRSFMANNNLSFNSQGEFMNNIVVSLKNIIVN